MTQEKGSAIILSILLLAIFTAISMNMYYISEKKGERAAVRAKGKLTASKLEKNTGYAYYELAISHEMETKNIVTERETFQWQVSTGDMSDYFLKKKDGTTLAAANAGVYDATTHSFSDLTKLIDIGDNDISIGGYKKSRDKFGAVIPDEYEKIVEVKGRYLTGDLNGNGEISIDDISNNYVFEKNKMVYSAMDFTVNIEAQEK